MRKKKNKFILKRIILLVIVLGGIVGGLYLLLGPTGFLGRAFGVKANIYVDAGSSYDVPGGSWRNLAQGGEEETRMLESVVGKVSALHPDYIRIDHIYDYYDVVSRNADGSLSFDFARLDQMVSDIGATGAKPFLSLSYMPQAIASGDVTSVPGNWNEWSLVVQKTIEHYSGVNQLGISNVYYEVWNEPDLFGGYKTYGNKNYLDLYRYATIGASNASNVAPFKIGGPATTAPYKGWLDNFVKYVGDNGLRLDFYSWHRYSYSLTDYEKDWKNTRRWIRWLEDIEGFNDIELIVSEIGIDSENSPSHDGNLSAIHTIATTAQMEGNVSKLFHFEVKDGPGPNKYWGRWGILTHEKFGIPEAKPRYHAISFLNRMIGNQVNTAGNGSWVKTFAKENNGVIRLLVVNYDPKGTHYEAVPIKFDNLPSNEFTYKRINLFGGSNEKNIITENYKWETIEGFNANTAAIFEVIPQF